MNVRVTGQRILDGAIQRVRAVLHPGIARLTRAALDTARRLSPVKMGDYMRGHYPELIRRDGRVDGFVGNRLPQGRVGAVEFGKAEGYVIRRGGKAYTAYVDSRLNRRLDRVGAKYRAVAGHHVYERTVDRLGIANRARVIGRDVARSITR